MNDFKPDRLLAAAIKLFGSQRRFAQALGAHETAVSKWIKGERVPDTRSLQAIEALGVNLSYLDGTSNELTAQNGAGLMLAASAEFNAGREAILQDRINRQHHRSGNLLPDGTRASSPISEADLKEARDIAAHGLVERSIEVGKITKDIPTAADITIPLHWQSVPAGDLAPIVTESFDEFNITKRYANTFAVYIRGESMIGAGIEDGDIAVFKEGMAPREGQVVYACVNNMCTVKVYTVAPDGHVVLTPANEKYQPIDVKDGDVLSIRGVMVNLVREPKPYREPKSHSKK